MRILLTGTSGFTGQHFAALARSQGHQVVDLCVDLTRLSAVREAVDGLGPVDAAVHLAAISFVAHEDDAGLYAVNTVGTTHLLTALEGVSWAGQLKKVLLASSANVYGNCPQSPIVESQAARPVNHYAASKLSMELLGLTYLDRLPVTIARPFNYTGPGQSGAFLIPKMVSHFKRGAPLLELGNIDVEREFNDVRMVAAAYLRLLDVGAPGETYNICTGQPHSLREVLNKLETLTGHRMDVKTSPALVRANEIHMLCGSPTKLLACTGPLPAYSLEDTLNWMLNAPA
jgi:GDP-6-deoxy-D-talose 4-dehydrogenase